MAAIDWTEMALSVPDYMSRERYRDILKRKAKFELSSEDDVAHIIAASNGYVSVPALFCDSPTHSCLRLI